MGAAESRLDMAKIKGLYAVTDQELIPDEKLEGCVRKAILGGVSLIQLRDKNLGFEERVERAVRLKDITRKSGVPLIINDDVAVAKESDADGVHLGKEDLGEDIYGTFTRIRKELGAKIIGVSCYDDLQMAVEFQKLGATYAAFGAAFASRTKPEEKIVASLDIFKDAKEILTIPVVAIGGINANNYRLLLDRGVDALAIVAAIFDGDPYVNAARFQL